MTRSGAASSWFTRKSFFAPDLTVAQIVYLGREQPRGMVVDDCAMNEGARQAVRNLCADIDPDVVVRRLSIAQRQLVQIAKVLLTGQKVVQRNLDIQPTLTVRPGFPLRVIVNRDFALEPYKG
jgi:ABC-type cobalamin/Fe3+-siderophores transport system ATPase subunit